MIYLCSNMPIVKCGEKYYSWMKNFNDFLSAVGALAPSYRLMVPCKEVAAVPGNFFEINVACQVVPLRYYQSHLGALFANTQNAFRAARILKNGEHCAVVVGTSTFAVWLRILLPRQVKRVYYFRGNIIETLRHVLKNPLLRFIAISFFGWHIGKVRKDIEEGRALGFAFGKELARLLGAGFESLEPLIEKKWLLPALPGRTGGGANFLRVLYVGRLSPEKNVASLVEAFGEPSVREKGFSLTVVGGGPEYDKLVRIIKQLGLAERVSLKGPLPFGPDLLALYDQHDLLCLPSFTEGFPAVVVEAFARGLPVLCTRVGGLAHIPDSVEYLEGFTPALVAASLEKIHRDPAVLRATRAKAFERVGGFTVEGSAERFHDTLSSFYPRGFME